MISPGELSVCMNAVGWVFVPAGVVSIFFFARHLVTESGYGFKETFLAITGLKKIVWTKKITLLYISIMLFPFLILFLFAGGCIVFGRL